MKKYLSIFCYLVIFLMVLTGCGAKSNETKNNEKVVNIVKDNSSDNSPFGISGTGVDYVIKNLKGGKYKISFYSKEYDKREFIKEDKICNLILNENNKELSLGIYQEDKIIRLFTNPTSVYSNSYDVELDFFNDSPKGIALSVLEKEKMLTLGEEMPIALFSLSDEDGAVSSLDIDEGYQLALKNEKDLVVFMKCELAN